MTNRLTDCLSLTPFPEKGASLGQVFLEKDPSSQVLSSGLSLFVMYLLSNVARISSFLSWLEIFHGVDQFPNASRPSGYQGRYAAGIIVHDIDRPDKILYYSTEPVIKPETKDELEGIVNNVVFPTGIVERTDLRFSHRAFGYTERVFDVYYGMADRLIGRFRLTVVEEA